jgi:hypothetical protein
MLRCDAPAARNTDCPYYSPTHRAELRFIEAVAKLEFAIQRLDDMNKAKGTDG